MMLYRLLLTGLPRVAVFLLACLPVLIGAAILGSMWQGQTDALTEADDLARRASYPFAVVGHILGGAAMLLLGLAQFSRRLRLRFPRWHRWAGRGLVAAGAYFALSGLWMNASPKAQADSWLHDAAQNVMAVAMLAVLALGVRAIWRRDLAAHRAWMLRAYAISLGAGTQTALLLPVFVLFGPPVSLLADLVFIAAWGLNLAVAERLIRRGARRPG